MTRLVAIRTKLTELASLDRDGLAFGAGGPNGHGYRERPALDAAAIDALERALGVGLPDELRAFLSTVHGGGPGPGYGLYVDVAPRPSSRAARSFPYRRADATTNAETGRLEPLPLGDDDEDDDDDEWPPGPGFVAIAHHGCGGFDVLVTAGDERGHVWFCDMAWFPRVEAGTSLGFLDWYEGWLDASLADARRRT